MNNPEKKAYIYMLRCADGSLYTGITTDPLRRWQEHEDGARGAKYMKAHPGGKPVLLLETKNLQAAAKYEYRIKKLKKEKKEALVLSPESISLLFPELYESAPARPVPIRDLRSEEG